MKINIDHNIKKDLLLSILEDLLNGTPDNYIPIDNERFFFVTIEDDDIFYHGTKEILAKIIEQTGLCPPRISGITGSPLFQDRMYITTNIESAEEWAEDIVLEDESPPVILIIKGKDINKSGCKAFVDMMDFTAPAKSIVLKGCNCIKAEIMETIR